MRPKLKLIPNAGGDQAEGLRNSFSDKSGAKRHEALETAQDLLDADFDLPEISSFAGRVHDIAEKERIVVFDAHHGRRGNPLAGLEYQALTLHPLESTRNTDSCFAGGIGGYLQDSRLGMIFESGSHSFLIGRMAKKMRGCM